MTPIQLHLIKGRLNPAAIINVSRIKNNLHFFKVKNETIPSEIVSLSGIKHIEMIEFDYLGQLITVFHYKGDDRVKIDWYYKDWHDDKISYRDEIEKVIQKMNKLL